MATQTDPVCSMQIEETDAAGQSKFEGTTYYFCSSTCQGQFDANPKTFTSESENKKQLKHQRTINHGQ